MGRANIYLSDDLERRVRAAKLAVSEICQQALLTAVEAAESTPAPFGPAVTKGFAAGWTAGAEWAGGAEAEVLLRLLRDAHLPEIPREQLPASWFSNRPETKSFTCVGSTRTTLWVPSSLQPSSWRTGMVAKATLPPASDCNC